jgi:CheY-like chemotaxis protein
MDIRKILLVDDNMAMNFLSQMLIKKSLPKCEFDVCTNGMLALDYVLKAKVCPEIILLDLNMPVMDGFEFLEAYEKQANCRNYSKIFVLTSSEREEDKKRVEPYSSVKGFLFKPLSAEHVKAMIEAAKGLQ